MIFRYEKYWMPFLAEVSKSIETDVEFLPPMDIHWVWHVHMLAPVSYKIDCINVAGRLLGHKLTNQQERESLRQKTKKIWAKHFPDEPFDLGESKKHSLQEFPNGLVSKIAYNIEEAAARQRTFYYQVLFFYHFLKKLLIFIFPSRYPSLTIPTPSSTRTVSGGTGCIFTSRRKTPRHS